MFMGIPTLLLSPQSLKMANPPKFYFDPLPLPSSSWSPLSCLSLLAWLQAAATRSGTGLEESSGAKHS